MKVAVLLPCYNEEITIGKVVSDFKKELPEADIYVFNNNSKDRTAEVASEAGAIVINEYKQGKGHVIRSMFRTIEADVYVMADGDDTYPAEEVHKLVDLVANNKADMAIGDRLSNGTYGKENKRNFHGFGNSLVKNAVNILFGSKLEDIMTGYRAFSKDFVKNFPVLSAGFEIETEMTFFALDKHYKIVEVPIIYRDRPEGSFSKLNTIRDGFRVINTIFRMFKNYKPMKFFGLVSLILILLGLGLSIPVIIDFYKTGLVLRFPTAILSMGIVICAAISFAIGVILDTCVRQHREVLEIMRNLGKN